MQKERLRISINVTARPAMTPIIEPITIKADRVKKPPKSSVTYISNP